MASGECWLRSRVTPSLYSLTALGGAFRSRTETVPDSTNAALALFWASSNSFLALSWLRMRNSPKSRAATWDSIVPGPPLVLTN